MRKGVGIETEVGGRGADVRILRAYRMARSRGWSGSLFSQQFCSVEELFYVRLVAECAHGDVQAV